MDFFKMVDLLETEYKHTELWFDSGTGETKPDILVSIIGKWRSPKILKRNGSIVAERTGNNEVWKLMGDYKNPYVGSCHSPGGSCLIDDGFIAICCFSGL